MIRVPLDEPTTLERGMAYTLELHGTREKPLGKVRFWDPKDVAEPLTVAEDFVAEYVDLKEWPE